MVLFFCRKEITQSLFVVRQLRRFFSFLYFLFRIVEWVLMLVEI